MLAAFAVIAPAFGQEQERLSLERVLALARERSPLIYEARARVDVARGELTGASSLFRENPTLEASTGPRRTPTGPDGLNVELGLSQPVELGGKRGARVDGAQFALQAEEARERLAMAQALGDAAKAYLRLLHAQQRVAFANETLATAEALARSTTKRFQAGEVPVLDANAGRVAFASAQAALSVAEAEQHAAAMELRVLLGLDEAVRIELQGDLEAFVSEPLPAPSGAPWPELVAFEAELERARAEERLGRAQAWPDLMVGAGYEREGDEHAVVGRLGISIPFFDRGQGTRQIGTANVRRLTGQLEAARRRRALEAEKALILHQKNLQAVQRLQQEALPLIDESLALSRKAYEAGEMGLADLLVIRREALDARVDYFDRLLSAGESRILLLVQYGALP